MTVNSPAGKTALEELESEFQKISRDFLGKINAWDSGTGDTIQDQAAGLAVWFRDFPKPIQLLSRLRTHHPDSFTHSVNVCLLTALQASAVDLPPDETRQAALAGLLHDVGKIAVPVEVLDKSAPLTRQEAAKISVHSVAGARALAAMPGLPRLVVVGAWEHHLHQDGKGGYPRPTRCNTPHPVSQMIALGDFFDSLTTPKPYRSEQPPDRVLQMMQERECRVFHRMLLKNFLGLMESPN